MNSDAVRARTLIEESPELVLVLDSERRVLTASRRAREQLRGVEIGQPVPPELLDEEPRFVPYEVDGRREELLFLGAPGQLAAYEELRAGFTAAVSHELRTPLARLLVLLESMDLPGEDVHGLAQRASAEVHQIVELIDDVLFLSELETGREVVALGSTPVEPVLSELAAELAERAARADLELRFEAEPGIEVPLRPRMLRTVLENLAENALRYAGPRARFSIDVTREPEGVVLLAADDGAGVAEEDIPRLFERFYRADRARSSRGTGLGLAIVKHVVTTAGGTIEARGGPGRGLEIRCVFPRS